MDIRFVPVQESDLPLLRKWIESPHWQEWWSNPEREINYIKDMIEGRDSTKPFIFQIDGRKTGYIQYWSIGDQINAGWAEEEKWLAMVPESAIGVDISIGDAIDLNKGIGSAVLRKFSNQLLDEGYSTILIDPDNENYRAIRAYKKAGYKIIENLVSKTGDSLIMQFML